MRRGIMQQADTPRVLYDHPVNLFVAGFIGSPSMNFVYGRLEGEGDGVTVKFGNESLAVSAETLKAKPGIADYAGKEVVVGMRPESFEVAAATSGGDNRAVTVHVDLVEQLGSEAFVHFTMTLPPVITTDIRELLEDEGTDPETLSDVTKFVARVNPDFAPKSETSVKLVVDTTKLHFFDKDTSEAIY
ncbi:MAG: ABC transporter ATP-binding protein, partial [Acidimicrobiia bacterium]|nr:ABC transporter ATP-binding protein [Acidimicrobiia bacterium]